jgi:hypothetical protein
VLDAEVASLAGITSNLAAKLNSVSATDMSRLAGVTAAVQTQINTINTTVSGLPLASGRIDRTGDTMTGDLGLSGAAVGTADRALYIDSTAVRFGA